MGGRAIAVKRNVSRVVDVERMFTEALDHFGQLDIVVASAGVELIATPTVDITEAELDRLYSINAKGAFLHAAVGGQARRRQRADRLRRHEQHSLPASGYALYGSSKMGAQFVVEVLRRS